MATTTPKEKELHGPSPDPQHMEKLEKDQPKSANPKPYGRAGKTSKAGNKSDSAKKSR